MGKTNRLNFVANEEYIVLLAESGYLLQITFRGDNDSSFALDRLDEEGGESVSVKIESFLKILDHTIPNDLLIAMLVYIRRPNAFKVWAKSDSALRVRTHTKIAMRFDPPAEGART